MEDERQYQNIAHYQQQQQAQLRPQFTPQQQQQMQQQQQLQQRGLLSPVNNRPAGQPVQHLRGQSVLHQQSADSPPPPPPPPVSTHPLLAGQAQQAVLATAGQTPWEREELERLNAQRRQEAARQWMEEQIAELEAVSNRTPKQEEQLRSLRLESEFRKRAMEAAQEEEEGEDDEAGAGQGKILSFFVFFEPTFISALCRIGQGMLRLVQEDLERARQWRMEKEQQQQRPVQQQQQQQQAPPPSSNGVGGMNNNNTSAVPDQERARKIEAFQRKQRELEATQAAEERILREAQRRKQQEDEVQHRQQQQQQQWSNRPSSSGSTAPSQRLDSLLVSGGPAAPSDAPPAPNSTGPTKRVSFFQEPASNERTQQREDPDVNIPFFFAR